MQRFMPAALVLAAVAAVSMAAGSSGLGNVFSRKYPPAAGTETRAALVSAGFSQAQPAIAQTVAPPSAVRAIDPGRAILPEEAASAGQTRFSFIAYGDTRGQADGLELQLEHGRIIDAMIAVIQARAAGRFPVRFIVQSGDGVTTGSEGAQWDVSFTPLIERLLRDGGVPYFLSVGNHDVTGRPVSDPQRQPGLRNTLQVMSKIYPPEGHTRRLDGYATYAFGYGHVLMIALDSNIRGDEVQLAWVTRLLEGLDRGRYPMVMAVFHHPVVSSGPHGGPTVEVHTEALRRVYMPLFRKHRVRMLIAGHDHLLEHWVETYSDEKGDHRIDHLITGGGGAPIYTYRGEPVLDEYIAAALPLKLSVEHLLRPGPAVEDNPHHFVIVEVDGPDLTLEVVSTRATPYQPYGRARVELL
jgi:hypothetical protein